MYLKVQHWSPYRSHENHVIHPLSLSSPSTGSRSDALHRIESWTWSYCAASFSSWTRTRGHYEPQNLPVYLWCSSFRDLAKKGTDKEEEEEKEELTFWWSWGLIRHFIFTCLAGVVNKINHAHINIPARYLTINNYCNFQEFCLFISFVCSSVSYSSSTSPSLLKLAVVGLETVIP